MVVIPLSLSVDLIPSHRTINMRWAWLPTWSPPVVFIACLGSKQRTDPDPDPELGLVEVEDRERKKRVIELVTGPGDIWWRCSW